MWNFLGGGGGGVVHLKLHVWGFFQNYISCFYQIYVKSFVKTMPRAFIKNYFTCFPLSYDCRRGIHISHFATNKNYTLKWHLINSVNVLLYIDIMVTMVWWKYVAVTNSQNHIWIAMWLFHLYLKCSTNKIRKIILDIEINDLILSQEHLILIYTRVIKLQSIPNIRKYGYEKEISSIQICRKWVYLSPSSTFDTIPTRCKLDY